MTTAGNVGWDDEIILRKQAEIAKVSRSEADLNAARRAGAPISTERKVASNAPAGEDFRRIAKVAESPEIIVPKTVTADVGKIMAKARIEKKITQKELSAVVHEKPSVVSSLVLLSLLLLLLLFCFPESILFFLFMLCIQFSGIVWCRVLEDICTFCCFYRPESIFVCSEGFFCGTLPLPQEMTAALRQYAPKVLRDLFFS